MADNRSLKQRVYNFIDVEMFPAKFTFFFTDGYFGSTMPFMNVFYTSIGLSPTYAGLISGISFAVSSIFNPLWSSLADTSGHRKIVFTVMCVGTAASVFTMPWMEQAVAKRVSNATSNITVHEVSNIACHTSSCLTNPKTLFYSMMALNIVAWIFYTSLRCFVDGTITNVVNTRSTKKNYGSQRAVSSIGYACFNFLAGVISDHYHPAGMSPYTGAFFVFLPCVMCMVPFGYRLIDQAVWERTEKVEGKSGGKVFKDVLSLFRRLDIIVFISTVFVMGIVLNIFNCFSFLLMEKEMKSSKTLMSLTVVMGVISEIVMFFSASRVITLLRGNIVSLTIGVFSYCPRYLLMSYIRNPWYILAVQPLQALGMGLAWTAIVNHAYMVVPSDMKVTAIALISSIVNVATFGISSMVGGLLFENYGGRLLFRYTGIIAGLWSLFMVVYYGGKYMMSGGVDKCTVSRYPEGISNGGVVDDDVKKTNDADLEL